MAPTTTTPTLRHKIGATVTPGDRLGLIATRNNKTTLISGKGTYIRQGQLYASLLGTLCATPHYPNDCAASSADNHPIRMIIDFEIVVL